MAADRARYLWNLGRPAEAAKWIDTLATLDRNAAGLQSLLGAFWFGGGPADTTIMNAEQLDNWRFWRGDAAAGQRMLQLWRDRAAKDSTNAFYPRAAAIVEAKLALDRHDPAAAHLIDVADSLCPRPRSRASWSSLELARLYERQGRVDRALRAVRRRWTAHGRARAGRASPSRTAWRAGSPRWPTTRSAPSEPTGITCGCESTPSPRASRSSTACGPS